MSTLDGVKGKKRIRLDPSTELLEELLHNFVPEIIEHPEVFLDSKEETVSRLVSTTKALYDYCTVLSPFHSLSTFMKQSIQSFL